MSAPLRADLRPWVPPGWGLIASVRGDLDKDGRPDAVLVLQRQDLHKVRAVDGLGGPRVDLNERRLQVLLARPGAPEPAIRSEPEEHGPTRRAEAGLAHLPGHHLQRLDCCSMVTADAGSSLVAIGDPVSGEAIFAFVITRSGIVTNDELAAELRQHVARVIGPIAKPKFLLFTPDLPKTRSGKIMRRLLRDVAEGRSLGDTTTLADSSVVDSIRVGAGSAEED